MTHTHSDTHTQTHRKQLYVDKLYQYHTNIMLISISKSYQFLASVMASAICIGIRYQYRYHYFNYTDIHTPNLCQNQYQILILVSASGISIGIWYQYLVLLSGIGGHYKSEYLSILFVVIYSCIFPSRITKEQFINRR